MNIKPFVSTELKTTLKEALTQQGIKLRTEFEPKQRDHIEDSLGMVGERAELIKRLAKQWAELDPADPYRADVGQAVSMLEADAQQGEGVPLDLLRPLSNTLVNLGYATPEGGMEHFSARIEWQLYNLCRGVDSLLNASRQHAKRVPPEESEDLYTLALKADNWGQP